MPLKCMGNIDFKPVNRLKIQLSLAALSSLDLQSPAEAFLKPPLGVWSPPVFSCLWLESRALELCRSALPFHSRITLQRKNLYLNSTIPVAILVGIPHGFGEKEKEKKKEKREGKKKREKKIRLAQRISHCKCTLHKNDNGFISSLIKISWNIFSRQEESQ